MILTAKFSSGWPEHRKEFWQQTPLENVRQKIRQLAGIGAPSPPQDLRVRQLGSVNRSNSRVDKLLLETPGGIPVPALLFTPPEPKPDAYLYLHGQGKYVAAGPDGPVEKLVNQGHVVMAVDLPGLGETRPEQSDGPFGGWKEFYLAYLLGKSLVGIRADAAIGAAELLESGRLSSPAEPDERTDTPPSAVHLIATGEAAVSALHAAAIASDLFATVHLPDGLAPWSSVVGRSETDNQLVDTVHGALQFYDLNDLARLHGHVTADQPNGGVPPEVEVTNVRRVFHNGEHNAFTDLTHFKDRFYLCFRSCPDGHAVHPTASIIILASDNGQQWRQVHRFHVDDRDTRDPHFLIFKDKLFVYTGTWYCGETSPAPEQYDLNQHLGYAAWSQDGVQWSSPVLLEGTYGHYIWRANQFAGKAYLCGRRKINFAATPRGEGRMVQSLMLESDDGLVWRKRAVFQELEGDETAFQFDHHGHVLAIGRRGSDNAQLLRSEPPYTQWDRKDIDRYVGGPLLARWGDRYVIGGRKFTPDGPRTSMCWLVDDQLHEFAVVPSGGDTSYPGLVALSPTRAVMSWYSSHEEDSSGKTITAIYMADLRMVRQ